MNPVVISYGADFQRAGGDVELVAADICARISASAPVVAVISPAAGRRDALIEEAAAIGLAPLSDGFASYVSIAGYERAGAVIRTAQERFGVFIDFAPARRIGLIAPRDPGDGAPALADPGALLALARQSGAIVIPGDSAIDARNGAPVLLGDSKAGMECATAIALALGLDRITLVRAASAAPARPNASSVNGPSRRSDGMHETIFPIS